MRPMRRVRRAVNAASGVRSTAAGTAACDAASGGDEAHDEGFTEENLWTGIGRARSGCGAAIVGDPDQVLAKLNAYRALGIEAFILSGYPHLEEAYRFAELVFPLLSLAQRELGVGVVE